MRTFGGRDSREASFKSLICRIFIAFSTTSFESNPIGMQRHACLHDLEVNSYLIPRLPGTDGEATFA